MYMSARCTLLLLMSERSGGAIYVGKAPAEGGKKGRSAVEEDKANTSSGARVYQRGLQHHRIISYHIW